MIDRVDRLAKKQDAALRCIKLLLLEDLQQSTKQFTDAVNEANRISCHIDKVKENMSIVDELLGL